MPACRMARLASFHLVRHHRAIDAMTHLATARRLLRGVPGLTFWRVLGTGRGADTGPSADLRRTALFAVWDSAADLERFLAATPRAWAQAAERYDVRLRGIGGHGTWRGVAVLAGLEQGDDTGPIAVVTRADVRAAAWRRFRAAGPAVSRALQDAPGLLAVAGVGEVPVGRLGTFSVWRDVAAVTAFAQSPHHADVVRRTRAERWYGEELFARFQPFGASGTWDGRDPLGG
jgi:heme-degrading monooxygenase HmoA